MKRMMSLLVCIAMALCPMLSACTPADDPPDTVLKSEVYALDTVINLTTYGINATKGMNAAKDEVSRLDKLFSVNDSESDIYRINHSDSGVTEVSKETFSLIDKALNMSGLTYGSFDITVYPAVAAWGFDTGEYRVPSDTQIEAARTKISSDNVALRTDDMTVHTKNNAQIDLGGIAKGYIGDCIINALSGQGVTTALINLGGNVRTLGVKPDGSKWEVGIKSPDAGEDTEDYFAVMNAENLNVITSGGYERNFTADGVTYHHIIDPDTARPAETDIDSVTVIGDDGAYCDAMSTGLFVMGLDKAKKMYSAFNGIEFVIKSGDAVYVTDGVKDIFTLSDTSGKLRVEYLTK